ncbi:DUF4249 domain-containing protein [Mucilaginibacter sp.]|uniref:DUF4249 domain-containing protein n=1 Tax=Mucilaginibacter sp. TaxID=1882438 RepID=UPI003D149F79
MRTVYIIFLCTVFLLTFYACRKPYTPTVVSTSARYLVVEGLINSGGDSTVIKLSRTIKLNSTTQIAETGARVAVEDQSLNQVNLTETVAGTYRTQNLNLIAGAKYRIHIYTATNKQYVSDFIENKITPPIDSISSQALTSGVQFYVSSHDPANQTHYYRWDYDETWTYFSLERSQYIYVNHQVLFRSPDSLVSTCYRFANPSNSFYVGNSSKLSADVIYKAPLGYVAASTGRLNHVYCLHVKQYAITEDAYTYWSSLKKNTEQLGSIFDPEPSTITGNIHSMSDPKEIVIGFISVSTTTDKRLFLSGRSLPIQLPRVVGPPFADQCADISILFAPTATLNERLEHSLLSGDTLLTIPIVDRITHIQLGYAAATKICVDCRVAGGTTVKPPYWP